MAPASSSGKTELSRSEDEYYGIKGDRKVRIHFHKNTNIMFTGQFDLNSGSSVKIILQTRKPLVEKKRRARINESLQELRTLLVDAEVSYYFQYTD